ncbi:MAG: Gfo/Idh/MocA family oxidoreductase [Chloroflexota bacterium]|nr:Gfo/Idh/MocA family oxidoreductase [Chloroflexota bacterium]
MGTSEFVVEWVAPAIRQSNLSELKAVVSRDPSRARGVAQLLDVERAVASISALDPDEIDAVHLVVPNELHEPMTEEALSRGFHVLVEKPMAPTVADARKMIAAAHAADRILAVGHCMAWAPPVVAARERLSGGAIGRPLFATISAGFDSPPAGLWRQDRRTDEGGGPLMDLGSHSVDVLLRLFGPASRVSCELSNVVHDYPAEDLASTLIRFASGAHAVMQTTFNCGRNDLMIQGTGGRLTSREWLGRDFAGDLSWQSSDRGVGSFGEEATTITESIPLIRTNVYVPQVDDVSSAILYGTPLSSDGGQGQAVLEILEAAVRSAAEGRAITIAEPSPVSAS